MVAQHLAPADAAFGGAAELLRWADESTAG